MTESEQLEIQIEHAHKMIAVRDAYIKLAKTKAFKDVIEESYFKEEAARLVMAKSNVNLGPEIQANIDGMIMGIGALANHFDMIMRRGAEMDAMLREAEETRAEMDAEEEDA